MSLAKTSNVILFKAIATVPEDDTYFKYLSANGLNVTIIPVIDFEFIYLGLLAEKLNQPDSYSGIIFTSPRSVKAVQIALQLDDYSNLHKWAELTAFVVGETTKKDAKALGFSTLNYTYGSVLQLTDLMRWCKYDKPLFYPKSNLAPDTLEVELTKYKISVDSLQVYKTVPHPSLEENFDKIKQLLPAKVVFFSPSGLQAVLPFLKKLDSHDLQFYAIGETTEKAMAYQGLTVFATSSKPTPEDLLKALNQS